ncbi:MAG: GNAT family N-acetyltransferase [Gammaproteobacteria bacterium]
MPDLLIKLYELDEAVDTSKGLDPAVRIRRALVPEKSRITNWVQQTFGAAWASECEISFAQQPVACFVAIRKQQPIGFACYNTTFKGFFGPIGVSPEARSSGIGKALLIAGLKAMAEQGYAYAIIGGAGPLDFFHRSLACVEIPDSTPGPYRGMLR